MSHQANTNDPDTSTPDMNNYFSETSALIRNTTAKFVEREITPFVSAWEEAEEFSRELYLKAGNAGLLGVGYPESLGGSDGDIFDKIALTEEIMRSGSGGVCAGLLSHSIGLPPIMNFASDEIKSSVVPQVLSGEKISALAISEPSGGSDVARLKTRAVKDGDEYVINGSKCFITSGHRADYYTVAVRTGDIGYSGISLILVERERAGFSRGNKMKKMGWRPSDTCELFFDDCRVPSKNLLGEENQGFKIITANFQAERLMLTIMAYMTAQLALEQCLEYIKQRKTFGRYLSEHQVIRHNIADMATEVEVSKEYAYRVASKMRNRQNCIKEISMAKNFATKVCDKVTYQAVQIFGGAGYMRESLVERLYRDGRILAIGGGTKEIMNEIIAKMVIDRDS